MINQNKILVEILETETFDRLDPFKKPAVWTKMTSDERELLARLLVLQGSRQLEKGDSIGLECFASANEISSHSPDILYRQALVLSSYRENISCLKFSAQTLQTAVEKKSQFFNAWYLLADVLTDIAHFEEESSCFIEADQKFENAYFLLEESQEAVDSAEFFRKWGLCLVGLGKTSGEPLDYHRAIEKYRQAYALGCHNVQFLNEYGMCLVDLAQLLDNGHYFEEALVFFEEAVALAPNAFDGWYNQGCCFIHLGLWKDDRGVFEQANQAFIQAVELNADQSMLWYKWGVLDATLGKLTRDGQKFESSLLKFARALELDPGNPQILNYWGESELLMGAQEERVDLIESARTKILNSLEIQSDDPHSWYLYGSTLNELGHYYGEEEYYHQAIEKFRYGLSICRHHSLLCYGMALSNFALGELTNQQAFLEKSMRYCARVIEYDGEVFPQFWNDWGVVLLKMGEITEQSSYIEMAIAKFEQALKQPVQYVEGGDVDLEWIYNYGCAFDLLGEIQEEPQFFEKAIQVLSQVVHVDPSYYRARFNLALAFSHFGELTNDIDAYQKGIEHFQILLEQEAEDEMVHLDYGVLLVNLALLVHDAHHPERSQNLYREAENHFMQAAILGNLQAYYQLAGLYSITGHTEQAMHYLEKAQFSDMLPGIEDLLHDDWLENLRSLPQFRDFVKSLMTK